MMSNKELQARDYLCDWLSEHGYHSYSKLLSKYHLNMMKGDELGYMNPATGTITINSSLPVDYCAFVVRHEIMHFYLKHAIRLRDKLAKAAGIADTDEEGLKSLDGDVFSFIANVAMDYEICNRTYTDEDKKMVRTLHALVTEDDHPGWETKDMEEMYDLLKEEDDKKERLFFGVMIDPTTFEGHIMKVGDQAVQAGGYYGI